MKDKEESHKKEVERKLKNNEKKIEKLAKDGQVYTYKHSGFWMPMDTLRDKQYLNDMCKNNKADWMVWNK